MAREQGSVLSHEALAQRGLALQAAGLLVNEFFPDFAQHGGQKEALEKYSNHQGLYGYVNDGGEVVGAALLNTPDTVSPARAAAYEAGEVHIPFMTVLESKRRRGIGSELLRGVEQDAATRLGASMISLGAVPSDGVHGRAREKAVRHLARFYGQRGYTPDDRTRIGGSTARAASSYVKWLSPGRLPARA